jgi:hypothetical protein
MPFVNQLGGIDRGASDGDMDFPFRIPWYSPVGLLWLDRKNTMLYSHYGVSGQMNPYGRSMLRPLYNLWLQTTALQQFKMVALNRRSFPLLLVYCNQTTPIADIDVDNPQQAISSAQNAQQAASKYLADINSVSTVILPGMKDEVFSVEAVNVEGNMDFFDKLENSLNDRKKSLLGVPVTLTAGGDSGSYALAYFHGQSNSRVVAAGRQNILDTLLHEFIKPLVKENFPENEYLIDDGSDWGYFEDEQISTDERLKNASLYDLGIKNRIIFPNLPADLNRMREGLGFNQIASPEEIDALSAELLEQQEGPQEMVEGESNTSPPDKRDRGDMTETPYEHDRDIG